METAVVAEEMLSVSPWLVNRVIVGSSVILDGSDSFDEDPDQTLSYDWVQTGGSVVQMNDHTAVQPVFNAPTLPTILTFTLSVTDTYSLRSLVDEVVVTVLNEELNGLSVVTDSPTTLGQNTHLTATINAGSNVDYDWDFGDGHTGSGQTASHLFTTTGVYTAVVTATNEINSLTTTAMIAVTNLAPSANAGSDQITEVNQIVTLDGGASSDPDEHLPLSYYWMQTGGPTITLDDDRAIFPTFTTTESRTVLTFTLSVTDSYGLTGSPDEVVIIVKQPEIAIDKRVSTTTANVGDTINYTYTITNSGDLPLANINPSDDLFGTLFATPISLNPNETAVQILTYSVAETDLPGPLVNSVIVSGTSTLGNVATASDLTAVILTSQPAITIFKEVSTDSARSGQVVTYTYTILNSGDVTLTDVTALDDLLGSVPLLTTTLPSLVSTDSVMTYTVSEDDLPGPLINHVTVTGKPPVGNLVTATTSVSLTLTSRLELKGDLAVVPTLAHPGETITFLLTLTNTGDVMLHNLNSEFSIPGLFFTLPNSLPPNATVNDSLNYIVQTTDLSDPFINRVIITAVSLNEGNLHLVLEATVTLEPYRIYLPFVGNSKQLE